MKTLVNLIHRVSGLPLSRFQASRPWIVAAVLVASGTGLVVGCGQEVDAGATAANTAPVNIYVKDVSKEKRAEEWADSLKKGVK